MGIKNIFGAIGRGLMKALGIVDHVAETLQKVSIKAMPVVEIIAKLTPTRDDDELVELYKKYGIPNVDKYLALPVGERGPALLNAATNIVQKEFPSVPMHQIQTAVQLALTALKSNTAASATSGQ